VRQLQPKVAQTSVSNNLTDTKSNPMHYRCDRNPNPNPTTKQHAVVSIQ